MRKQKITVFLLSCVMAASIATGCGNSSTADTTAEAPTATETPTETPTEAVTETPAPTEEAASAEAGEDAGVVNLTQSIISGDGICQLDFPETWTDMKGQLNADLALEAGSLDEEEFVTLLGEAKDGSSLENLTEYTDVLVNYISGSFTDPVVGERQEIQINGKTATKTKITGTTSDVEVAYWVYTIEGTSQYVQLCAWTTPGNAANGELVFDKIAQSYKEL